MIRLAIVESKNQMVVQNHSIFIEHENFPIRNLPVNWIGDDRWSVKL